MHLAQRSRPVLPLWLDGNSLVSKGHHGANSARTDRRALFPLPKVAHQAVLTRFGAELGTPICHLADWCILGLNTLNAGVRSSGFCSDTAATSSQLRAIDHVITQCHWLLEHIQDVDTDVSGRSALDSFGPRMAMAPPVLTAENVDLPDVVATCDPMLFVGDELRGLLEHPHSVLPQHDVGVGDHKAPRGHRAEYAALIARMVDVGKCAWRFVHMASAHFLSSRRPRLGT